MPVDIRSFVKDRHSFYEVAPLYVLFEERLQGVPATRKVQAGFDVDVYGVGPEDTGLAMPPRREYTLAYAVLRALVAAVSRESDEPAHWNSSRFPPPSFSIRGYGKVKGLLRIRVSHWRGLDQPAGHPGTPRAREGRGTWRRWVSRRPGDPDQARGRTGDRRSWAGISVPPHEQGRGRLEPEPERDREIGRLVEYSSRRREP